MLRHLSVEADDPRRLALVIAELWQGHAFACPRSSDEGWMAVTDGGGGAMIEVLPRGTELREGDGDTDAIGVLGPARRFGANHVAMDTVLDDRRVFAIGEREGWRMKYGRRAGGCIAVIETWVEGCLMFELVTPALRPVYSTMLTMAAGRAPGDPAG